MNRQRLHCLAAALLLAGATILCAQADSPHGAVELAFVDLLPPPRPMGEPYRILLSRSIFSRDHNRPSLSRWTGGGQGGGPASTQPASSPLSAEAGLALKGVGFEDGSPAAFIEDGSSHQTRRLRLGDPAGKGRVTQITLDGIDLSTGGTVYHVLIGQLLDGSNRSAAWSTGPTTNPAVANDRLERVNRWRHAHDNDASASGRG